jgi:hypothetical protein
VIGCRYSVVNQEVFRAWPPEAVGARVGLKNIPRTERAGMHGCLSQSPGPVTTLCVFHQTDVVVSTLPVVEHLRRHRNYRSELVRESFLKMLCRPTQYDVAERHGPRGRGRRKGRVRMTPLHTKVHFWISPCRKAHLRAPMGMMSACQPI